MTSHFSHVASFVVLYVEIWDISGDALRTLPLIPQSKYVNDVTWEIFEMSSSKNFRKSSEINMDYEKEGYFLVNLTYF